jgi:hypothetical protein
MLNFISTPAIRSSRLYAITALERRRQRKIGLEMRQVRFSRMQGLVWRRALVLDAGKHGIDLIPLIDE